MARPLDLRFLHSATNVAQLDETGPELAVVGRSNVGKSSLINALANRKQLARVSNTPGRTQLINVFAVGDGQVGGAHPGDGPPGDGPRGDGQRGHGALVDLPGYGYAKASKATRRQWPAMIEGYLLDRRPLVRVLVLVDGAIGPTPLDEQMLDWLRAHDLPHSVIATKADKVKSSKRARRRRDLAAGCQLDPDDVVWVSATTGAGVDAVRDLVRIWLA